MKVVQINIVCGNGSTGKICVGISKVLNVNKIENYILYTHGKSDYSQGIRCTEYFSKMQALRSRLLGNYGFNSNRTTKRLIEELDRISPDVVHLHNLHGHNCNLTILMNYFRKKKIKLIWTFHDCWTLTAYCPHYIMAGCDKWKTGCHHCVQKQKFSWLFDRSEWVYKKKKDAFTDLDLTIVTPSQWLASQVEQSFLQDYRTKVIYNGIDTSIFKPTKSNFRGKHDLGDKCVILGVAAGWGERKGLDVFLRLSKRLDKNRFRIILVGTTKEIDKHLSGNIISIHRTANQQELAEIYSAADVFVNPTREEVFGLVNVEANACGIPVITYRTGGSPECIDETSGIVVECDDEDALYDAILKVEAERPFSSENCRKRALNFSEDIKYCEYIDLYKELVE